MNINQTRKRQIARQLGVSVRVLEQYLQLKRAEVMEEGRTETVDSTLDPLQGGRDAFRAPRHDS